MGCGGTVPSMRSDLFGEHLERTSDEPMSLHNPRMLKVRLDGDSVTVNGANVLAFEPGLSWDIRRVEGASALSGGVFNMVFTGTGRLVISAYGTPVVLGTAEAPTFADLQSAIAWTSTLQTRLVRTAGAGALVGRGSGEAFQLAFSGQGFVVVQASEGPVVPRHSHGG